MTNKSNKNLEVKRKAKNAKKRLLSGYWDIVRQKKEIALTVSDDIVSDKTTISDFCKRTYGAEDRQADAVADMIEEERLFRRVCGLLQSDDEVSNPIGLLLDNDKMASLDEAGRMRYVLQISKKYREMCNRYYAMGR